MIFALRNIPKYLRWFRTKVKVKGEVRSQVRPQGRGDVFKAKKRF